VSTPPADEPLTPIVLPPGSSAGGPIPTVGPTVPAGAATRSPVLLWAVAIVAIVAMLTNLAGLFQFPTNAPVEAIYAFGISVDLFAIAAVCVIGALLSRRGYPLRARSIVTIVALVFTTVVTVLWAIAGGVWSIVQLAQGGGRYMDATGGLFFFGALWVLATIFAAHGFRRKGEARNNLLAVLVLAVVGVLVGYAVFSSVIYGLGLTD
jgi:hypothetical protein